MVNEFCVSKKYLLDLQHACRGLGLRGVGGGAEWRSEEEGKGRWRM